MVCPHRAPGPSLCQPPSPYPFWWMSIYVRNMGRMLISKTRMYVISRAPRDNDDMIVFKVCVEAGDTVCNSVFVVEALCCTGDQDIICIRLGGM